jgi:hypothetical protein
MTYEEAILKIATALVYEKGMTPQETARAVAEAIGLKEIMIKAQNWEDSFKDHGVANLDLDDHLEVPAPLAKTETTG